MDQRPRDAPPIFYIDPELANGKYHALLTDTVDRPPMKLGITIDKDTNLARVVEAEITRGKTPRGIYAFETIDARNSFMKRCNLASGIEEYNICYPVTVPNLVPTKLVTQRGQARKTEKVNDRS